MNILLALPPCAVHGCCSRHMITLIMLIRGTLNSAKCWLYRLMDNDLGCHAYWHDVDRLSVSYRSELAVFIGQNTHARAHITRRVTLTHAHYF